MIHLDPVAFNLIVSAALLPIIGILIFTVARRDGISVERSFALAAIPAFSGNFVWLGLLGMEHLLLIAVTVGMVLLWLQPGRRSAVLSGVCMGVLVLIRPEAIIFGPCLLLARRAARRTRADVLWAAIFWGCGVLTELSANLYTSGHLQPGTLEGRRWLYFHATGGPHSLLSIALFVIAWMCRPAMDLSLRFGNRSDLLRAMPVILPTFLLACVGAVVIARRGGLRTRLLILVAAAHLCFYAAMFPSTGQAGRYQPFNLLLLLPAMFFGFERLIPQRLRRTLAAVALVIAAAGSLRAWCVVTQDSIAHVNQTHGRAAEWLRDNAPPNARTAVFDIGKVSYTDRGDFLDLGGIIDQGAVPYLVSGRMPLYLTKEQVAFVSIPSDSTLGRLVPPSATLVARFCSPPGLSMISEGYTSNAARCQEVFRLSDKRN